MKYIITAAVFLCSLSTFSQVSLGVGAGLSTKKAATAELLGGYDFGAAFVQGGYIVHVSNAVDKGAILNIRAGHTFFGFAWSFQPSIGYAYHLKSTDDKSLNKSVVILGLYCNKWIAKDGQAFAGINYTSDHILIMSFGLKFVK